MKSKTAPLEWLDRSLLTSPYCYALCLSEEAFKAEMKNLGVSKESRGNWMKTPQADATLHYLENVKNGGLAAIICLRTNSKTELEQVYGLLVHEAVHLWQAIKDFIGEDSPAKEEEAYAIQRIAQSLMYSYKEQTTSREKKKK